MDLCICLPDSYGYCNLKFMQLRWDFSFSWPSFLHSQYIVVVEESIIIALLLTLSSSAPCSTLIYNNFVLMKREMKFLKQNERGNENIDWSLISLAELSTQMFIFPIYELKITGAMLVDDDQRYKINTTITDNITQIFKDIIPLSVYMFLICAINDWN